MNRITTRTAGQVRRIHRALTRYAVCSPLLSSADRRRLVQELQSTGRS